MARTFVYSDNLTARVEVVQDPETGEFAAYCTGHVTGRPEVDDLLSDTHERFSAGDALNVAGHHADRCTRCADADCRTLGSHEAGHRCRKP